VHQSLAPFHGLSLQVETYQVPVLNQNPPISRGHVIIYKTFKTFQDSKQLDFLKLSLCRIDSKMFVKRLESRVLPEIYSK
jgi:hypothetical protein